MAPTTKELSLRIKHLRDIVDERERQVEKALANNKEKLSDMNEFRSQQKDMIATLATKEALEMLQKEVAILKEERSRSAGRAAVLAGVWSLVVLGASALMNWWLRRV